MLARDITVRDFCCGTAPVLNFVQVDSRFLLRLGPDPLLPADQLVVEDPLLKIDTFKAEGGNSRDKLGCSSCYSTSC